jgi:hypothetical protein
MPQTQPRDGDDPQAWIGTESVPTGKIAAGGSSAGAETSQHP